MPLTPPALPTSNTPPRWMGYDYLETARSNAGRGMLGDFFQNQAKIQSAIPYSQRLAKRGDVRYGFVGYGTGMLKDKNGEDWQKKFSTTEGAGLWSIGINPDSPTLEQDIQKWYQRYLKNPNNFKDKNSGTYKALNSQYYGRDDRKVPGLPMLRQMYPNAKLSDLIDFSIREVQAQNALPPRDITEGILMTLGQVALGFIPGVGPALAAAAGAAHGGVNGGWGGAVLGGLSGWSAGSLGSSIGAGISSAGGVGSYLNSIPKNISGFLRAGPELTNINTVSMFPDSPWIAQGAAAGASGAMRAAGSSGFLNNVFGTASRGAGAVPGGGSQMAGGNWFTDILREAAPSLLNTGVQAGINYFSSQSNQDAFNQAAQQAASMSQFNPYSISGPMGGVNFDGTNATATLSPAMQKQLAEADKVAGRYLTAANKFNPSNYAQNYYETIKQMNFPQENATTNDLLNRVYATGNWGSTVGAQDISSVARQQQIADQVLRIQAQQAGAQEQDRLFTNYFNAAKTAQSIMASPYELATMGGNLGAQGAQAGANAARYPWLAANSSINASTAFWDTIAGSAGRLAENAFNKYASYSSNPSRASGWEASPYFSGGNTGGGNFFSQR